MFITIIFIILAYLIGSISSAILVCKGLGLGDPRDGGSGNPGATNVLRLAGKKPAALVLVCDVLKGTLAILIAQLFGITPFETGIVAIAVVLGHMYPLYFGFKGGKGVATALGVFIGIYWVLGVFVMLTWLAVAKIWKYSSLAALVAVTLAPFYAWALLNRHYVLPLLLMTALILYQHRGNIQRLRAGTEPKIGSNNNITTD